MKKTNAVITKIIILLISLFFIFSCGGSDSTAPASCTDGIKNGNETDIDCGGDCNACPVPESCVDGIKNGDETDVDCGGSCIDCNANTSCSDGIKNGDETGVDCGGSCPPCEVPATCTDGIQNGDETGVDCGGSCIDCNATTSCTDGIQNGDETGVDCGGSCPSCVIFRDLFNIANTTSGNIGSNWEFPQGLDDGVSVSIENNRVKVTQSAEDLDVALGLVKGINLTESKVKLSMDFSYTDLNNSESMTIGILAKVDFDDQRGYGLLFEGSQLKLFKFSDGGSEEIHEVNISLNANTDYVLELNFDNSTITGHVKLPNGNIISTVSGTDNTYIDGSVGIVVKSGVSSEIVYLDNYVVE